ncbi:MAG: four helix bundle protein [Candidatus Paceibacterota bacterium]|jgi:four helix bundle protein
MQNFSAKLKGETLVARSYKLSLRVINLMDCLPNKKSAQIIANQLIRAATSIGANQVEARASSSRLEFKKFFEIALKSANECKYWLCLLKDAKLASEREVEDLLKEVEELSNMLAKSVVTLKSKKF